MVSHITLKLEKGEHVITTKAEGNMLLQRIFCFLFLPCFVLKFYESDKPTEALEKTHRQDQEGLFTF